MSTTQFQEALKAIRISPPNQHMLHAFETGSVRTEPSSGALYMVEHIDFLSMFGNIAQPVVRGLAEASGQEDGVTALRHPPRARPPYEPLLCRG